MNHKILGGNFPVVLFDLDAGESIKCQAGGMAWMDSCIKMGTKGGGLGKMIGRKVTGESAFQNVYTATAPGQIAVGASMPGEILAVNIYPGCEIVAQKGSFLASEMSVNMSTFFQKKLGTALFGGEGFVMQKYSGQGTVFVEVDGSSMKFYLHEGEQMVIETGYLVMMDSTCSINVVGIKGLKNIALGGEGLFNTVITGPGNVILQSMPMNAWARRTAEITPKKK